MLIEVMYAVEVIFFRKNAKPKSLMVCKHQTDMLSLLQKFKPQNESKTKGKVKIQEELIGMCKIKRMKYFVLLFYHTLTVYHR